MKPKLSVIIPCYNEEEVIQANILKLLDHFSKVGWIFEVIIVDDGSEDATVSLIEDMTDNRIQLLKNGKNRGKGYAVRQGALASKGDYVFFTDADLSMPIDESDQLFAALDKGYDIAIGSKSLPTSKAVVKPSILRILMGRLFNRIVRLLTGLKFKDTQCGFKCFNRKSAKSIFSIARINDFSFDVEVLYLAQNLGFKVLEVPVKWEYSQGSKVRVFRDSLKMLFNMSQLRKIHQNLPKMPTKGGHEEGVAEESLKPDPINSNTN